MSECPHTEKCAYYASLNAPADMLDATRPEDVPKVAPKACILDEAYALTRGQRNADYGHPLDDFGKTAAMWSAIFGVSVTPEQVALAMVCVKISRELNRPLRDNLVDACGYLSTIEMIQQERERRRNA